MLARCFGGLVLIFVSSVDLVCALDKEQYFDTIKVINGVRGMFRCDCVYIIRANDMLVKPYDMFLQRMFSNEYFASAQLDSMTLARVTHLDARSLCNRPLHVTLPGSNFSSSDLIHLFKDIKISGPIWLFFLEPKGVIEKVFEGVDIPFDCQFFSVQSEKGFFQITELYRVGPKLPLIKELYASWSRKQGLKKETLVGFYKRRSKLTGLQLKATINQRPPMTLVQPTGNTTWHGGFSGSIWDILEERMGFTTVNSQPRDRKSGNPLPNGEWSGMIGEVVKGTVDIISSGISMTSARAAVMSLSFPLSYSMVRIFIKRPEGRTVNLTDFLSPFGTSLWLGLFTMVITTGAILAAMVFVMKDVETAEGEPYTLYESIFVVFGAVFCQQGQTGTPESASCRLIFFISYMVGVIAISAYSATVVSTLSVFRPLMPYRSLEDVLADKTHKIGMVNTTFYYTMTQRADSGVLRQLYDTFLVDPKYNPTSNFEGFERVCKESKFAFITEEEIYYHLSDRLSCELVYLPVFFVKNSISLAFSKESPYVGVFNSNILKLKSAGVLAILYDANVLIKTVIKDQEIHSVTLVAILPLLGVLGGGSLLALATMGLERLLLKYVGQNPFYDGMPIFNRELRFFNQNIFKNNPFIKKTQTQPMAKNKDFTRYTRKVRRQKNAKNGLLMGLDELRRGPGNFLTNRRKKRTWDLRD